MFSASGTNAASFSKDQKKIVARRKIEHKKVPSNKLKTVRAPKDRGGLGIKDPSLVNFALRAKLIWRMITGKLE
jgi:hypothetical protein